MAAELLVRPGSNDHQVIADLLAPGGAASLLPAGRALIDRLVVDAHVALQRPLLAQAAAGAGIPYLIDPLTHLLQGELRPADKWARLPFGRSGVVTAADLASADEREQLVAATVDYQVEAGATAIIPPYLYVSGLDDPFLPLTLDLIGRTATHMRRSGIQLPIIPLFCGQLQAFAPERAWPVGLDAFATAALDIEPVALALCLSPTGAASDSYHKVLRLFLAAERLTRTGVPVLAWRQGIYGPALVAAGAQGYETGIGTSEQCNVARTTASRKPLNGQKKRSGGAAPGIYLESLGRSVPASVAQALLGDMRMRAKVMCDDEHCCPQGPTSTIDQHREHAVRTRARTLERLDEMPQRNWRLHRVSSDARNAATLLGQANNILRDVGVSTRLQDTSATALARVADFLSHEKSADAG